MKNKATKRLIAVLCTFGLALSGGVAFAGDTAAQDAAKAPQVEITVACGDDDGDDEKTLACGGDDDGDDEKTLACGDHGGDDDDDTSLV